MGLDAGVMIRVRDLDNPEYRDRCLDLGLGLDYDSAVDFRIGCYSAIHTLRALAFLKCGATPGDYGAANLAKCGGFLHLIDHADNEGWYLSDAFARPTFEPVSIGSSPHLRGELLSLKEDVEKTAEDSTERHVHARLLLLAEISCDEQIPIKFH